MNILSLMSATPDTRQAKDASDRPQRGFTAVVYFHGMGRQRHYEEMCRLVEGLDRWVYRAHLSDESEYPGQHLEEVEGRDEELKEGSNTRLISYMKAQYLLKDGERERVRFYEGYWAPETSDGTTLRSVVLWLGRQWFRPALLLRTPWRGFEQLRRGDLAALSSSPGGERLRQGGEDPLPELVGMYHDFHDMEARRRYPRGRFRDFLEFLGAKEDGAALLPAAKAWGRFHFLRQVWNWVLVTTVFVAALAIFFGVYGSVSWALRAASTWLPSLALPASGATALKATLGILAVLGGGRFLTEYLGDVQQFATYEEAQALYRRRSAILEESCRLLRHVLSNPACKRVVVVGHSLGSAVALDSLLNLRRANKVANPQDPLKGPLPLSKIEHFITLASPIDKINYFFSAVHSRFHRYERLSDDLRGDIGSPPFSKVGLQPHIHWINFWDRGDIIGGPIHTLGGVRLRRQRVDNVRIAQFRLPDPGASHNAYFVNETVLKSIFRVVFFGDYGFLRLPPPPEGRAAEYPWLGPGKGSAVQNVLLGLLIALPWIALLAVVALRRAEGGWLFGAFVLLPVVLLTAGALAHRLSFDRHLRAPRGPIPEGSSSN